MGNDTPKILRVPKYKQFFLILFSATLFFLGAIPSIFVTYELSSILPLLGGLLLAFFAHALFTNAKTYLIIKPDALEIVKFRGIERYDWDEICEFAKGEGINRYKVRFKLASDSPPLTINLGIIGIECKNIRYLPSTFGMKASDLADLLNKIKRIVAEKKQFA